MSQYIERGPITRTADEAIPQFSTVTITATGVKVCDLADSCHGTAVDAAAIGERVAVRLLSQGTHKVIAQEAFVEGATLYTEANGKVQDTAAATANPCFIALEAATADGDIVEALPLPYGGPAAS